MLITLVLLDMTNKTREWLMSVTQIDIDDDALERVLALSRAKTKKEDYLKVLSLIAAPASYEIVTK
jgi:hypothetical protein